MPESDAYRQQFTRMIEAGWRVEEDTPDRVTLVKREYGSPGVHLVLAIFTIWWLLGVPNLLYAAYKYFTASKRTVVWKDTTMEAEEEKTVEPAGAV